MDQQARKDYLGLKVYLVFADHRDLPAMLECRARKARLAKLVFLEILVRRVRRAEEDEEDRKDIEGKWECQGQRERWVRRESLA